MNLICASSVTFAGSAFGPLGSLTLLPEGEITTERVRDADAVITRSKTKLNRALFEGSRVKLAGTCTAGTDHADAEGLAALGIHFASAPGCNANAVSEYVVAALLEAYADHGFTFADKTLGVVGHGEVGSRVARKAEALGMKVLRNDPPKAESGVPGPWTDLDELVARADVLTLHVPLVETGPWPTRNLLSAPRLANMKPGAVLINACRGEVLDGPAAAEARSAGRLSWLVLDVWDPEPDFPLEMMAAADLATPHIAGHSVEGKVNGTRQIFEALCAHFDLRRQWDPLPLMPPPLTERVRLPGEGDFETRLRHAVRACYELREDDRALRASSENPGARFTKLRRNYRDRREFSATTVTGLRGEEREIYAALGFQI
ncbi:MAG: 4-phosphoerythronate dehydrogenase [Verrucomicrobia bacterium]|nr:4-phosphoerythronate dehydrogenase [Verrucomicrobiota bacterium]MCH8512778.1 4-phosphoerythronate dehydrogenase [Kiritimatiellia bacterium]